MIILDVLTQADYNVKDACEKLISLGHEKKESILTPPKLKDREEKKEAESPKPSPAPTRPKNLSEEHKKKGIFYRFLMEFKMKYHPIFEENICLNHFLI